VSPQSLPIWEIHADIVRQLRVGNRLVLVAPTGSGKTTQVPQMLLDAGIAGNKKIVVLQPRRVAARTVAARVAWERKVQLGGEVGYQIRFDDQTSLGTRICYITEGILLRWLQDDPALRDVAVILFDEFHERNLLSDVALALAKEMQRTNRPDLKLAVMSATLDAEPVAAYLECGDLSPLFSSGDLSPGASRQVAPRESGDKSPHSKCPILVSEGQSYPVAVHYTEHHDERPVADQAADVVEHIVNSGAAGDILVFMPGVGEINSAIGAIRAARTHEKLALIPLHGELQAEEQDAAFAPNPLRKIVVATNVAETSVTIDGILHVVDGGVARVARYDSERGIGTLFIEPISRASADQRKGRAGRTAPGDCWRLWTESGHLNRPERNTPEIQRSDLAEVVLLLHSLGIKRAAEFDWLDKPDPQAVERAEKLLVMLGALRDSRFTNDDLRATGDERVNRNSQIVNDSDLTSIGRQMLRLPMHPRYSRMLVEASKRNCVRGAAMCAALVSGRDLLQRVRRDEKHISEARELFEASQDSDFLTLMRAFQFAKKSNFSFETCRRYGINAQVARQVEQTFDQIVTIAEREKLIAKQEAGENQKPADDALLRCLMSGFIDQLCVRRDLGSLDCDMTEKRQGTLMRESVVQNANLFVAATIREVPGRGVDNLTLLGLATAVKREWIEEMFPQHLTSTVEHLYDRTHKRVAAVKLIRFVDLVIHHEHQREVVPEASGRALAEAARRSFFELPLLNHDVKQFIARVNLVCAAMPELEFPPLDEVAITAALARAFHGLTLAKEAQATHVKEEFAKHLVTEQRTWLDELAPLTIAWPDGRKVKLLYAEQARDEDGEVNSPEVQMKLHECFALKEHPHICEGKVPVKLWLTTPDGKRLEATFNWPAFRANTYPRLKPALQKKFPATLWV
jgi:ATP-dependent helicase HrpB